MAMVVLRWLVLADAIGDAAAGTTVDADDDVAVDAFCAANISINVGPDASALLPSSHPPPISLVIAVVFAATCSPTSFTASPTISRLLQAGPVAVMAWGYVRVPYFFVLSHRWCLPYDARAS